MNAERKYTRYMMFANGYRLKCSFDCDVDGIDCVDCPHFENVIDRLGEYEDTGLSPKQVKEIETEWVVLRQLFQERIEAEERGELKPFKIPKMFEDWFQGDKK